MFPRAKQILRTFFNPEKVFALVATCNHGSFLGETLHGIFSQKLDSELHVIVVDDCPNSESRDLANMFKPQPGLEITWVENSVNKYTQGFSIFAQLVHEADRFLPVRVRLLRRLGFASDRNIYLALCEGDDYWVSKDKLQKQLDFFRTDRRATLVFSRPKIIIEPDGSESHLLELEDFYSRLPEERTKYFFEDFLHGNPVKTCTAMYRRSAVPLKQMKRKPRDVLGDWLASALAAQQGYSVYLPDQNTCYRVHAGGVWSASTQVERQRRAELTVEYIKELTGLGGVA